MTSNCIKIDYLTCSLLPGSSTDSREAALGKLLYMLGLDGLQKEFQLMCSNYRYEAIYRYQNISLKIATEEKFAKNGICIEISGSGIDYYENYLAMHKKTTLRDAFNRFRLLYLEGYKTQCSRIDIAIDDKCFGDDRPLLDLDDIESVLKSRYFVTRFRHSDPNEESGELVPIFKLPAPSTYDDKLPYRIIESMNMSSGVIGKTIYLGKRKSLSSVRIYDKLAEQQVKGEKPPDDLKHWVRFELEFHDKNAMAVLSKFLDCRNDTDFSAYISRVSYDLIRFVDKDHTRLYNCTVCEWWMKFLGSIADKGMYINKLSTNAYLSYKRYAKRCLAACLASFVTCEPDQLNEMIEEGKANPTRSSLRIEADYKAYQGLSPGDKKVALEEAYRTMSGEDYWRMFADQTEGDFDERMKNIFEEVAQQ